MARHVLRARAIRACRVPVLHRDTSGCVGIPVSIRKGRIGEQLWMCFEEKGGNRPRRVPCLRPRRTHAVGMRIRVAPAQANPSSRPRNAGHQQKLRPMAPKKAHPRRRSAGGGADPEGGLNHERDAQLGRKMRIPIRPLRKAHPRNTLLPATCPRLPQVPVLHRGPEAHRECLPKVPVCPDACPRSRCTSAFQSLPRPRVGELRDRRPGMYRSMQPRPCCTRKKLQPVAPETSISRPESGPIARSCAFVHPTPPRHGDPAWIGTSPQQAAPPSLARESIVLPAEREAPAAVVDQNRAVVRLAVDGRQIEIAVAVEIGRG